jgi:hypothetical protein
LSTFSIIPSRADVCNVTKEIWLCLLICFIQCNDISCLSHLGGNDIYTYIYTKLTTYIVSFPSLWQITWENQLKERKIYFNLWFQTFWSGSFGLFVVRQYIMVRHTCGAELLNSWQPGSNGREKKWEFQSALQEHATNHFLQVGPTS